MCRKISAIAALHWWWLPAMHIHEVQFWLVLHKTSWRNFGQNQKLSQGPFKAKEAVKPKDLALLIIFDRLSMSYSMPCLVYSCLDLLSEPSLYRHESNITAGDMNPWPVSVIIWYQWASNWTISCHLTQIGITQPLGARSHGVDNFEQHAYASIPWRSTMMQ